MFARLLAKRTAMPARAMHMRFMSQYTPEIDSSRLTVTKTDSPKTMAPKEELTFGSSFSDHMLEVNWEQGKGWDAPKIIPYGDISISPAASSLHYALQAFEGMKAYKDANGKIRLFRPEMNMARMNTSCDRLFFPNFNGEEWLNCIRELVRTEGNWIPEGKGYSLYLRPTVISTHPFIGVAPAGSLKLYVICSPVGPYYPTGFKPVKLYADPKFVRAWPGGTGATKIGGNYAMGILPGNVAMEKGYAQMLWLFGDELQVTEVGTMNQFFLWEKKDGSGLELVTAALDGTILPGVTRNSVLALAREWGGMEVSERHYTLHECMDAVKEGRMVEAFGSGTAAIVSPVDGFHYDGVEYDIPLDKNDPTAKAGPFTQRIADTIMGIQYGEIESDWSEVIN